MSSAFITAVAIGVASPLYSTGQIRIQGVCVRVTARDRQAAQMKPRQRPTLFMCDKDEFSNFPRYNNADDIVLEGGAPVLDSRRQQQSSMQAAGEYPEFDRLRTQQLQILSSFGEKDMTPELKYRVYKVMLDAYSEVRVDQRPSNEEVRTMLGLLWQQGADAGKQGDSLKQLVALTTAIETLLDELRGAGSGGGESSTDLASAALRNARARVLVYAKDGYMYDARKLAFWTSFLFGFVP
jgi:hypothetical protein